MSSAKMSMVPLLFRDWWEDFDRPSRLMDQHFGLGLRRDDLLSSLPPSLLRPTGGYLRPWRTGLTRQDSGHSLLAADKDRFQVILDVQQFSPSELTVKTADGYVVVEGRHQERQDEHGFVSRHFLRRYLLPQDADANDVVSSLSSDGVLTVTAPKRKAQTPGERVVPIQQTGTPAVAQAQTRSDDPQPIVEHPK